LRYDIWGNLLKNMAVIDRLVNAWEIFKTSFEFLGRDKSLMAVPILMIVSAFALVIPFIIALALAKGGAIPLVAIVVLFFAYFWFTFLGAAQAWMVHEVAQGKDATLGSGFSRAGKNFGDIMAYAAVMLLVRTIISSLRRKGGAAGRVGASFLDLIVGIAGKLVLPAMIVTHRSFKESIMQLKQALKAIPEIATFEVGIRPLVGWVNFVGFAIAVAVWFSGFRITAVAILFIWILLVSLVSIFINQTYYTLLYLTVIEKKKIKGVKLKF